MRSQEVQGERLRTGAHVAGYTLEQALGAGGAASVWVASRGGRLSVLKVLHPHLSTYDEARVRFRREVEALTKLVHPHVVRAHGLIESGDFLALELEYIRGLPLHALLRRRHRERRPFHFAEILELFGALLSALEAAHRAGIIHRDVKPANIMISGDDLSEVRLIDFGIAKLGGREAMTTEGRRLGTPAYMAPEQALGREVDHRADLFSLTTVLFECLTFHRPWMRGRDGEPLRMGRLPRAEHGNRWPQVLERIVRGPRPPPSRYCPRLGGAGDGFFADAWQLRPSDRPPTAASYRSALEAVLEVGAAAGAHTTLMELEPSADELKVILRSPASDVIPEGTDGALAAGASIGPFVLDHREVESGRETWRGRERSTGRPVQLELFERSEALEGWLFDEAQASCRLVHPNLLGGVGFGRHRELLFLAREWRPHLPLGDLLAASGGRLSFAAAARVGADVASALAHAHGKARLVHGSLTPSSLVVGPDGLIAVADFGRPREADAGPHRDPGYLPPERLMGAPPSPRGDLYALAVTLHELLSGRRLFPVRPSLPETLDEILRIVPPELEGAPPDLAEIVGAALAKEPEARPADLEQVADRLAAVAGAAGRRELASTAGEILGVTPPPAPFVATPALAVSRSLEPRPLERRRSSERLLWVALAVGGWSTALALGFGRGGRAARPAAVAAPASPKSQPAVTLPAPAAAPVPPAGASTASFSEASSSSSAEISAPASATPAAVAPEAGAPSDAVAPAPRSPQRPEPRPRRRSSTRAVKWDRDAVFRAIDRLREREPDLASDFFVRLSEMDPKDERALHALGREVRAALAR